MRGESRRINLRRDDECSGCGRPLAAGVLAVWDPAARVVRCVECDGGGVSVAPPVLTSAAGASAQREYERRRVRREAETRARWGLLGSVAVRLSAAPASERAWRTGSAGEIELAGKLSRWTRKAGVLLLHDRLMPGGRANIDHIAIGPSGVFVIDAKRYSGRIAVRGRPARLFVAGRDRTKLVEGVRRQVAAVEEVVGDGVPVQGLLCFVDGDWPWFGTLQVGGIPVLPPHKAARLCCEAGAFDDERRAALGLRLASAFVPA